MSAGSGEMPRGTPRVAIVGGGLAGLAAAAALAETGAVYVQLYEARRRLGGRAASFRDASQDTWVDHCQHVSMRCCTNLADFCRRTGLEGAFARHRVLHFIGPDGRRYDYSGSRFLPAPLHLAGALWRLKFLSPGDRMGIARALHRLARLNNAQVLRQTTIGDWLRQQRQSDRAIEQFWELVLQSALGESVERASLLYARKVFVDGFMAAREAYEVEIPTLPLGELYGSRLQNWLVGQGVQLRLSTAVQQIELREGRATGLQLRPAVAAAVPRPRQTLLTRGSTNGGDAPTDATSAQEADTDLRDADQTEFPESVARTGEIDAEPVANVPVEACDFVIVAAPWRQVPGLFCADDLAMLPVVQRLKGMESSPISAVHLWFDRPITELPHAVLVGRLSQWVFQRPCGETLAAASPAAGQAAPQAVSPGVHYYQVVISASRSLQGRSRDAVVAEVVSDLQAVFADASSARLLAAKVVTDPHAVFSVRPGIDTLRPPQATEIPNLFLAGDWTQTAWPATMEGAVRSGYLAAEAVLAALGTPLRLLVDDLPPSWLARRLIRPLREPGEPG